MAVRYGVDIHSIIVDPGVDFAKTPTQTIELLQGLDSIVKLGHPILLALSRKDFIGALTRTPPKERLAGTLGAIAALRQLPSQILRVHDVRATLDMITVLDTLAGTVQPPPDLKLEEEIRHQRREI
jgi:dihydropteroate synthase